MRSVIAKVPIPLAGLALALTAVGTLLQPAFESIHLFCGILALVLTIMLVLKLILFPHLVRRDMKNSILASVSGTFFMLIMQLAVYLATWAFNAAVVLWEMAIVGHLVLIIWFTIHYFSSFKLREVFPTYFICYVGIIVASVTSPAFGMQALGQLLFWFGFVCYLALLVLVTLRYLKHGVAKGERPLICIYAAPMSLSLVGYLSSVSGPNLGFVVVLVIAAQLLLGLVLTRLPFLVTLRFYPSFAAMTFPFVISATGLGRALAFIRAQGVALPFALDILFYLEVALALTMVAFVLVHYVRFLFARTTSTQTSAPVEPLPFVHNPLSPSTLPTETGGLIGADKQLS